MDATSLIACRCGQLYFYCNWVNVDQSRCPDCMCKLDREQDNMGFTTIFKQQYGG